MTTSNDASKASKRQPLLGKLILIRHAESEWNALGKWTGHTNVHLTAKGRQEAVLLGEAIKDIELHHAYSSQQIRTTETLVGLLKSAGKSNVICEVSPKLNERDYGDYTGLNKWDVLEQLGKDVFTKIRRGWDEPIPGGETLKMVHARAVPFYKTYILPKLLRGQNVLIVSHGNTLRSLIKHLDKISDRGIAEVEMPFGSIYIYEVNKRGYCQSKQIRRVDIVLPHA